MHWSYCSFALGHRFILSHWKCFGWVATLQWCHNECDGVSNHEPTDCLLKRLFRRKSKKTSKLCVTGLCAGNSLVTGEFPAQRASNAEMFPFDDFIMMLAAPCLFLYPYSVHWWNHPSPVTSFMFDKYLSNLPHILPIMCKYSADQTWVTSKRDQYVWG